MTAIIDQQRQDAYEAAKEWDGNSGHSWEQAHNSHRRVHSLLASHHLKLCKSRGRYGQAAPEKRCGSHLEAFAGLYGEHGGAQPPNGLVWGKA